MVIPVTSLEVGLVFRLLVAMGIGALIGIEREQSASGGYFAGGRTLPLVALFGALTQSFYPDTFPIALGLVALLVTAGYLSKVRTEHDIGITTAVAALLTFVYGALTTYSSQGLLLAIVLGAVTTIILAGKEHVTALAGRIDQAERRATLKFLIVAFVVLPILPNHEVRWFFDINPQFVWLMVVFVSGLSFLGYILAKVVGTQHGIGLSGLLGGFVSSTATAVSMSSRTNENHGLSELCAFATVIATVAMLPRAVIEVAVIYPGLVSKILVPILVMSLVALALAVGLLWRVRTTDFDDTELTNPFRLRHALSFGAVFAVILVVSERASMLFGPTGIYATAFVAGLADVDSITISLAKLALEGDISSLVASTGIVIAAIANTLVKIGITWVLGTRTLGKIVTAILGIASAAGIATLFIL